MKTDNVTNHSAQNEIPAAFATPAPIKRHFRFAFAEAATEANPSPERLIVPAVGSSRRDARETLARRGWDIGKIVDQFEVVIFGNTEFRVKGLTVSETEIGKLITYVARDTKTNNSTSIFARLCDGSEMVLIGSKADPENPITPAQADALKSSMTPDDEDFVPVPDDN